MAYFDRKGIDPKLEPDSNQSPIALPQAPAFMRNATDNMTTNPCVIHVVSILVYTYCSVDVSAISKKFEGHSGGLGAGELTAVGVIYYNDLSALLNTNDFGVFYGAEDGGVIHVTWGANGHELLQNQAHFKSNLAQKRRIYDVFTIWKTSRQK